MGAVAKSSAEVSDIRRCRASQPGFAAAFLYYDKLIPGAKGMNPHKQKNILIYKKIDFIIKIWYNIYVI